VPDGGVEEASPPSRPLARGIDPEVTDLRPIDAVLDADHPHDTTLRLGDEHRVPLDVLGGDGEFRLPRAEPRVGIAPGGLRRAGEGGEGWGVVRGAGSDQGGFPMGRRGGTVCGIGESS